MSTRKPKRRRRAARKAPPARREVSREELSAALDRARAGAISAEDAELLSEAIETLAWLTEELEKKGASLAKLRKLLFGSSSEKTKDVLAGAAPGAEGGADANDAEDADAIDADEKKDADAKDTKANDADEKKKPGHGRNGADAYTSAEHVDVPHGSLAHNTPCPQCEKGKIYRKKPSVLVRVRAVAPLLAICYELERLRCNLCGATFTAEPPPGVGEAKYDETAAAMLALLRYGCGLPFNRVSRLGVDLKVPMPPATQWDIVKGAAVAVEPAWAELVRAAADGDVLHNDDTNATVLSLGAEIRAEIARGEGDRTGMFTSGVVSTSAEGREIVLYFTGREHAGENLAKVLAQRGGELSAPIQMCDALARNLAPGEFDTLVANCMAHARRHFVDVVDNFPDEVAHVLGELREVFVNEATAKKERMSPERRLAYHQERSGPVMRELETWLAAQLDERRVEENSTLGGAIKYMQNHWEKLTLFLRVPGAPIDNNLCEQILKRAIVHRKNSLFYKTENGARVGDIFMSLIVTAERAGASAFDYLVALQRHRDGVAEHPERWMPWNYLEAVRALRGDPEPSA